MNNEYLIPANSKRSMLIFGMFTPIDLLIFGVGLVLTLALIFTINDNTVKNMVISLIPIAISSCMIAPVPNHRNVWNLTANIYKFYSQRRKYYWRGWCVTHGKEEQESNGTK